MLGIIAVLLLKPVSPDGVEARPGHHGAPEGHGQPRKQSHLQVDLRHLFFCRQGKVFVRPCLSGIVAEYWHSSNTKTANLDGHLTQQVTIHIIAPNQGRSGDNNTSMPGPARRLGKKQTN